MDEEGQCVVIHQCINVIYKAINIFLKYCTSESWVACTVQVLIGMGMELLWKIHHRPMSFTIHHQSDLSLGRLF